jgi:hypothetical protein
LWGWEDVSSIKEKKDVGGGRNLAMFRLRLD